MKPNVITINSIVNIDIAFRSKLDYNVIEVVVKFTDLALTIILSFLFFAVQIKCISRT